MNRTEYRNAVRILRKIPEDASLSKNDAVKLFIAFFGVDAPLEFDPNRFGFASKNDPARG